MDGADPIVIQNTPAKFFCTGGKRFGPTDDQAKEFTTPIDEARTHTRSGKSVLETPGRIVQNGIIVQDLTWTPQCGDGIRLSRTIVEASNTEQAGNPMNATSKSRLPVKYRLIAPSSSKLKIDENLSLIHI